MIWILQKAKSKFLGESKGIYSSNLTDQLFKKFLFEWLVVSVLVAALITGYAASSWHRYGYVIYDSFVKLIAKDNVIDGDIVIIAIDEKSISALGRWPWSRDSHSQLIDSLQGVQPQALGFNLLFTESGEYKEADRRFKNSIENSRFPVIMPVLQKTKYNDFYFSTHNTLLSTVDMTADPDGVIRRIKLIDDGYEVFLPQLSLQAYWATHHTGFQSNTIYDEALIDYSFNKKSDFKKISYIDVLQGNYTREDFFGKIILVGVTAVALGDRFATPITTSHGSISIHAQVLNNIINDSFIYEVDAVNSFYISFSITLLYLAIIFINKKIHISYIAIVFSIVLILMTLALLSFEIWWSPLSCIVVFFTSWIIWNWRRSLAVIAWCRHSLNYFHPSSADVLLESQIRGQRSIIQDRFQFELNLLENMLVSAKSIESQKTKLRTYLSHDLRSPKASMMALVHAQRNPKTALPEQEFHTMMEQLINKSLSLLDDLLVLSRSEAEFLKAEPVLLAAVIQDALDYLWPQFEAHQIEVDFDTDNNELGEILGDAKLLLRAFSNILDNSIKYAGRSAKITVAISRSDTEVILKISDNGPGFNSAQCKELTDYESSNSLAYSSYGLGLELVNTVVRSHHATLHSESLAGQGVMFIFKFPILDATREYSLFYQ